jgi:hypothetical protein
MSTHEEFWNKLLAEDAAAIRQEFDALWVAAGAGGVITPEQAARTLDLLFKRSHLDIFDKGLMAYFPTEQGGPWNALEKALHLWWVDHATAGVNGWGTVGWFSSKKRTHVRKFKTEAEARAHYGARKPGARVYEVEKSSKPWRVTWKGYAGAVTHFVAFMDGTPFYLVKIKHRCWGEPKRNRDGIHIEMVNPLVCSLKGKDWHFWAGKIPQAMLSRGQAPVELDTPFRGAKYMMPYTWQQVVTDIKLKRLCIAATGRMSRERMSEHTDWRESKYDMGPLWPRDLINDAAFDTMPIEEYEFMKQFVLPDNMDDIVDPAELKAIEEGHYDLYDMDEDTPAEIDDIDSTIETQQALLTIYGKSALPKYGADGDLGPETCRAVRHFQEDWNKNKPADSIKEDGIPGTVTWRRLEKALAMGQGFNARAFD